MKNILFSLLTLVMLHAHAQTVSNIQYQYNPKGELKSITENGITLNYYYDASGNRVTMSQVVVGELPVAGKQLIRCYPNPTQAFVTVEITSDVDGDAQLQVVNHAGQLVASYDVGQASGTLKKVIDFSHYPAGIYFIQADVDGIRQTVKVIRL